MSSRLQEEILQTRSFASLREEALLQLARSAALLMHGWEQVLRPFGITATQYNVLRILRGAGDAGLPRIQIAVRLIAPVPDVSRLLDRMVHAGLVTRARGLDDRRTVRTRITGEGLRLLEQLDTPSHALPDRELGHMTDEQVRQLIFLLEAVRYPAAPAADASHRLRRSNEDEAREEAGR